MCFASDTRQTATVDKAEPYPAVVEMVPFLQSREPDDPYRERRRPGKVPYGNIEAGNGTLVLMLH